MSHLKKLSPRLARVLTLIGAGIVLATFVVKDVISERLKDANDALVSARSLYLSQTYNTFSQEELAYIKQEVDEVVAGLQGARDPLKSSEGVLSARAQADADYLSVVIEDVDNLGNLLGESPAASSLVDSATKLYGDCQVMAAKVKSITGRLQALYEAFDKNANDPQALNALKRLFEETAPSAGQINSLTERVGELTKKVLADRKTTQVKVKHQYAIMRDLCYLLFILGWVVGLLGQLWGVQSGGQG